MRAMIGVNNVPNLLVDIEQEYALDHFDFWVVNGAWHWTFFKGNVSIYGCPGGDYTSLGSWEVLSTDMNRLRGDYQTVFDYWNNPNYVAPAAEYAVPTDWDDDIPF